jgi:chaperonin GroES
MVPRFPIHSCNGCIGCGTITPRPCFLRSCLHLRTALGLLASFTFFVATIIAQQVCDGYSMPSYMPRKQLYKCLHRCSNSNSYETAALRRDVSSLVTIASTIKNSHTDDADVASVKPSSIPTTLDGQEIRQEITAMNNIIFVKVKEALSTTMGGIVIPDQSKQRPTEGIVVAAGPGKLHPHTGRRITNPIAIGMNVV